MIFDFWDENGKLNYLLKSELTTENNEGKYENSTDIIFLSENKAALLCKKFHGKKISMEFDIYLFNFFNNYAHYMINKFVINIYEQRLNNIEEYSLIFKYKNLLGFKIETLKGEAGFILFGYYNSTDPKQILNIKKDGLNYYIKLKDYLNLQSNIFEYEIKCIKIIEIPNLHESGLFLISNITKSYINKNDCIDINTKIYLYFIYNGTLKKGNYLFKFSGVVQEPFYEKLQNYSDEIIWNTENETLINNYIEEYNQRRNLNITGKTALVQINVLNNIKVFCDKKYDNEFSIKNDEGKYIACGTNFYDVENDNEITQLNLGINYYFDKSKNSYIKCHEKCKMCSREYNNTNMNCDECFENYFIRNDNCLEISKCDYNYYYDFNLNLICINRDFSCPDFKPYEKSETKECIQNCTIDEFNNICNPTNNLISINDTYKKLFQNLEKLDLKQKLLNNKEKYVIKGNNVTFIFSTSEIEKNELYNNSNTSSIIVG